MIKIDEKIPVRNVLRRQSQKPQNDKTVKKPVDGVENSFEGPCCVH
jgi:hypothetical protein